MSPPVTDCGCSLYGLWEPNYVWKCLKKKNSAQEPTFTLAYARYGHRSCQRLMELAGVLVRTFVVWKITFQSGLTVQWEMS